MALFCITSHTHYVQYSCCLNELSFANTFKENPYKNLTDNNNKINEKSSSNKKPYQIII